LSIYPNPNSGTFTIVLQSNPDFIEVSVNDLAGKLIMKNRLSVKNNSVVFNNDLSNGMYIVTVKDKDGYIYRPEKITVIK
jgi:hypothetical protein